MKKALVILVIALSIVSIVVVGFMGSDLGGIYPRVYMESLRILDPMGNEAVVNRKTGERWITIDYYDRTTLKEFTETRTVEENGVMVQKTFYYIEYTFQVAVEPANATEKKYEFIIDQSNAFVHYSNRMADSASRGMFRIDEIDGVSFNVLGYTDFQIRVGCRANDGGTASDNIWFKIDYSKYVSR